MVREAMAPHERLATLRLRDGGQAYTSHFELSGRINVGPLTPQLGSLRHGDHFCSFYENADEQLRVSMPFFKEAIRRGEACLYVADDRTVDEVCAALEAADVDVAGALAIGQLVFVSKWQWRNPGDFHVPTMATGVRDLAAQTLAGFTGLWVAVDMTWTLDPDIAPAHLAEWESLWNTILQEVPVVLLCQYNRRRLEPETLEHELQTHPMAILGDQIYPNFFYEPPDVFLKKEDHAERVNWMFDQLRLAAVVEEERTRRIRSELMVKEIHHRVKNSLQIAAALLSIQASELDNPEAAAAVLQSESRIRTIATVHAALYARDGSELVDFTRHLEEVVPSIAQAHQNDHVDIRLVVDAEPVLLEVDKAVSCALIVNELVTNAYKHAFSGRSQGSILVALENTEGGHIILVEDNGRGMSGPHGSSPASLGLELVRSLVGQVRGAVEIHGDAGTRVTVRFPRSAS